MAMKGNRGSRRRSVRIDILPGGEGYGDATAALRKKRAQSLDAATYVLPE